MRDMGIGLFAREKEIESIPKRQKKTHGKNISRTSLKISELEEINDILKGEKTLMEAQVHPL